MAKKVLQTEKNKQIEISRNSSLSVHYYNPIRIWSNLWSQTLIALNKYQMHIYFSSKSETVLALQIYGMEYMESTL